MGVNSCLTCRDVRVALEWLETAFGVHGQGLAPEGARDEDPLDHAILTVDGATILVESERPEELHGVHAGQGWIYVTVVDADAHYHQARTAGAQILSEPHDFGEDDRATAPPTTTETPGRSEPPNPNELERLGSNHEHDSEQDDCSSDHRDRGQALAEEQGAEEHGDDRVDVGAVSASPCFLRSRWSIQETTSASDRSRLHP